MSLQETSSPPSRRFQQGKSATLQEHSKLDLIRYVSGEFAKATRNLPAGKDGFLLYVDKPMKPGLLERAVATHEQRSCRRCRSNHQLEFHDHSIVVDVNAAAAARSAGAIAFRLAWAARFQPREPPLTTRRKEENGHRGAAGHGSTIYLEFTRPFPDLTPR